MLPHLDAAYGLARYLLRNEADAEDVVQEAYLRALKYFGGFQGRGGEGRAWVLAIVRNTAFTWRRRYRADASATEFDESSIARPSPASIQETDLAGASPRISAPGARSAAARLARGDPAAGDRGTVLQGDRRRDRRCRSAR